MMVFQVTGQQNNFIFFFLRWMVPMCGTVSESKNFQRLSGGDFHCPWRDVQLVKSFPAELFQSLRMKDWTWNGSTSK